MPRTLSLSLVAALLWATPLAAQGWIEPVPDRPDPGIAKIRTSVTVRITDRIARVEVEEYFRNDGGRLGEGDYLYPLPGEAVFSEFSLFQGDRELRGETMEADRARRIYEEIVRRRKDPALIELVGHGLVRARVFPIQPGETRRITLRYTQVLARAGDALELRYAAGGRYAGAVARAEDTRVQRPVAGGVPLAFTVIVEDGHRFRDPFSPTDVVRVTRDDGRLTVRPEAELAGDFALFLPFADDAVGLALATYRPSGGEDGYFMLTLSPGDVAAARVPRDVTVVVDVSGSMSGEKIEQARGALRQLLGTLGPRDRFRLIAFSSGVRDWRPDWTDATPAELRAAREWVDDLRAEGGTNIAGALEEAFREASPDARLPVVIFMTDGLPSVGEQDPDRIAEEASRRSGRARVFAFGVGYDVNTVLLDRLGAAGRGGTQYVQPGEDVERAVGVLAARISHPVLTDLQLGETPAHLTEIYPRRLPDLFAGEDLVLFGRYRPVQGETGVLVSGRRAGHDERFSTHAQFPEHAPGNDYLPRLWASRKLGELAREVRTNGSDPGLVEEIRRTALRYGLLSEYTSYLVQEPGMVAALPPRERRAAFDAAAVTGQAAVLSAERSRAAREVNTIAALDQAQKAAAPAVFGTIRPGASDASVARTVAGRLFTMRDGVWTDAAFRKEMRVVEIEPFGQAYFTLLRALPELEPCWKELASVVVAGSDVAIRVAPGGAAHMSDAEIARLVRSFRGR